MKLLMSGGTGFFGRAILRYIHDQHLANSEQLPAEVVILTRSPDMFLEMYPLFAGLDWLRFHRGDIEQPASLPNKEKFKYVLHAAADSTDATHLSPLQRYDQIVNGTRNLLDFAVGCGAERFLLTSSGAVYGPQPVHLERITEDCHSSPDPLNPVNVYGFAKRAAEHLCALYGQTYNLHTIIARCFAFVGQDLPLDVHFAIGNFIRDALWGDEIIVHGDGTPLRSYLAQDDLALWLITLLMAGSDGKAYNVGSDKAISISDLAHRVRDLVSPKKTVRILGKTDETNIRHCYVPDIGLARRELGLDVFTLLDEAIVQTADVARMHNWQTKKNDA